MDGDGRLKLELETAQVNLRSVDNPAGRILIEQIAGVEGMLRIRADEHLEQAQQVMDRLLAKGKLVGGEEIYLDALSDLVTVFEDEHHAIEPASDADMLRHLLDAKGVTQAQLSQQAEIAKSTISEVLAGKKPFSRRMIRKLADYFNGPALRLSTASRASLRAVAVGSGLNNRPRRGITHARPPASRC